jgi:hypothetical protein
MTNQPSFNLAELVTIITGLKAELAELKAVKAQPAQDRAKIDYDSLTVKAFARAGFGSVKPRVDVKTYNLWLADGYRVKQGEKSIPVKQLRLFHISQCDQMPAKEAAEARARLEAKRAARDPQPVQPAPVEPKPAPVVPAKPAPKHKAKANGSQQAA